MRSLSPRTSFTERNPLRLGVIGTVAILVVLLAALNISRLSFLGGGREYRAAFTEVGNLAIGDDVEISGLKVGEVSSIALVDGYAEVGFTISEDAVELGQGTRASVVTQTVLGKRAVRLASAGAGELRPGSLIPVERTDGPYDLTQALTGLTERAGVLDTTAVASALNTLADTVGPSSPKIRAAVTSLSKLSAQVASRDGDLRTLLDSVEKVSSVLAERHDEVGLLLADGSTLLAEVTRRRAAVEQLVDASTRVAEQLSGLVADNRASLQPALDKLNQVTRILNDNKTQLEAILTNAGVFATGLGESLGSGPFFSAYVQNLVPPSSLLPVLSELGQ